MMQPPLWLVRQNAITWLFATALLLPLVLLLSIACVLFGMAAWRPIKLHILGTHIYAHLPRPRRTHRWPLLTRNLGYIRTNPPVEAHLKFVRQLASGVYVYRGMFYSPRLFIAHAKPMLHLLSAANSYVYEKPVATSMVLTNFLGNRVLVAEHEVHTRQSNILQPAFGVRAIRELTPVFMRYSRELAQKIGRMVDLSSSC